ncbi:MAG: hypothetical protein MUF05_06595 [Candidatus Omnitrophica bacterium]|jgi:hypothetical protein|nr:hypothetical protein [Candidatus Omnitrophota bacterium]
MRAGTVFREKGQAVIELAIFGGLILFLFGMLISYMQRLNDQQYTKMEAFRRALQKGCTYIGSESEGAGASVQYTLLQNRRNADFSSFKKGSPQTVSGSANVFWAVPKVGEQPENTMTYRINEDEYTRKFRDYISEDDEENRSLRVEDMTTESNLEFEENVNKQEDYGGISNIKGSSLKERIRTTIPYTIRENDDDSNDDNDKIISGGNLVDVEQYIYRDPVDGQYKYSSKASKDGTVERTQQWVTPFAE